MTELELETIVIRSYLAGIIDGEGWIGITRSTWGLKRKRRTRMTLQVTVNMTDFMVPLLLHEIYGGGLIEIQREDPNHKPQLRWRVSGRKALAFLKEIRPYVRIKAAQIDLAVKFQEAKVSGYYLTDEARAVQEAQYLTMRELH